MFAILAIESSTSSCSVALLDGSRCLAERRRPATRAAAGGLMADIRELTAAQGIALESIALYALGTGPGGFTGLRIAAAAVQGLALPAKTPVMAVGSAEALAVRLQREAGATVPVLIVGDARRERLWLIPSPAEPAPQVLALDEAAACMQTPGLLIASPDYTRLAAALERIVPASATLLRQDCLPTATDVGQLAFARQGAGIASAAPEPIYVHPPVFVEPTFTEAAKRQPA